MSDSTTQNTYPVDQVAQPDRVQLTRRNAFWEIRVDGVFHSDYRREEEAVSAAELIKLSL